MKKWTQPTANNQHSKSMSQWKVEQSNASIKYLRITTVLRWVHKKRIGQTMSTFAICCAKRWLPFRKSLSRSHVMLYHCSSDLLGNNVSRRVKCVHIGGHLIPYVHRYCTSFHIGPVLFSVQLSLNHLKGSTSYFFCLEYNLPFFHFVTAMNILWQWKT